ncbi:sulfotransferase family protein [Novispirillum sp. DQ9]|uniref:sulfotransferase family protein n=1 Tax=Novispirillum sp. DQ9 TaxID=3398612 RepID=UPI003C7A2474
MHSTFKNADGLIASRTHGFIYVNVPKSACTTIKNLIYILDHGQEYKRPLAIHHDAQALLKARSPDGMFDQRCAASTFSFTFVRHPFLRAYSCFNEKVYARGRWSFPRVTKMVETGYGARFPSEGEYSADQHEANFHAFLLFVRDPKGGATLPRPQAAHWEPQCQILRRHTRWHSLDFVGRVESFRDDMAFVLRKIGAEGRVDPGQRWNEGPPAPFKYEEVLSDRIRGLLEDVYGEDMAYFAYAPK